jgi:hypothetical protein
MAHKKRERKKAVNMASVTIDRVNLQQKYSHSYFTCLLVQCTMTAALPQILALNPVALCVAIAVCLFVELISALARWRANKLPSESAELAEDAKRLKVEVGLTNYPAMFVQNAKLQRQLIKVEKVLEKMQTARAARKVKVCCCCA